MNTRLLTLLLFGFLSSFSHAKEDGQLYQEALLAAIDAADRIEVIEHSDKMDFKGGAGGAPDKVPFLIYRQLTLTPDQTQAFRKDVAAMAVKTQDAFPLCIFVPHHTIRFYSKNQLQSELQICFQCSMTSWPATDKTNPWSLIPTLKKMIERVGLDSERDWKKLAIEKMEEQS